MWGRGGGDERGRERERFTGCISFHSERETGEREGWGGGGERERERERERDRDRQRERERGERERGGGGGGGERERERERFTGRISFHSDRTDRSIHQSQDTAKLP